MKTIVIKGEQTIEIREEDGYLWEKINEKFEIAKQLAEKKYVEFGIWEGEPLLWEILTTERNGDYFLFCDKVICRKAFDINGSNIWEKSTLKKWLNEEFHNHFL